MHFCAVIKFCMNFFAELRPIANPATPWLTTKIPARTKKKMLIEKLIFVRECRRECEGHDGAASSDFKVPPINETCWWEGTVPIFEFQHFNIAFALFLRYRGLSSANWLTHPQIRWSWSGFHCRSTTWCSIDFHAGIYLSNVWVRWGSGSFDSKNAMIQWKWPQEISRNYYFVIDAGHLVVIIMKLLSLKCQWIKLAKFSQLLKYIFQRKIAVASLRKAFLVLKAFQKMALSSVFF